MALDPYQPCICGSGKKLKFCCGDIAADVEKIDRMLQGEQYAAALSHLRTVTAKYPDRASMLGMQAMLETHQEDFDAARKTLNHLIVKHPDDYRGWAELAILEAVTSGGKAAIEPLQKAIENISSDSIPARLYLAIGVVAQALLEAGDVYAARVHFGLQASMAPEDDPRSVMMLMRVNRAQEIPLLMKQTYFFADPPEDATWKAEYLLAQQAYHLSKWLEAERILAPLAQKASDFPELWRALGMTRANLANDEGAAEALQKFSRADVPLEEAVEASALATFLDPQEGESTIEVVHVPRTVLDKEALETAFLSSDFIEPMQLNRGSFPATDGPPPVAMFAVFDRPLIKNAGEEKLSLDKIPNTLGQVYLYGRETDREARVELVVRRDLQAKLNEVLNEVCGIQLGEPGEERVLTKISQLEAVLSWRWRLPQDITLDQQRELVKEKTRETFLNQWPETSLRSLGGKTPKEAASDPAMKIPLLADVLRLDLASGASQKDFDFNELRRLLNLPELGPVDPEPYVGKQIPLSRLGRLEVSKLTDEQLLYCYYEAEMHDLRDAMKPLAEEVLGRESCHGQVELDTVYGNLASVQQTVEDTVSYLDKAREAAKSAGKSPANWELAELRMRMMEGNVARSQAILQRITKLHMQEPGIRDRLMQMLMEFGVIGPDGQPAGPPPGAAAGVPGVPGMPAQAAAPGAEPEGGIWTPDKAAGGEEKSKLWVPGMD